MTSTDDRATFEEKKRAQAIALGRDRRAFEAAVQALHAADKYDYPYLWSWMGVPIIQLPADIMATQEIIWATKPDLVVETGVARGGSVLFMASILELIGKGKVIGVDSDIRAHNRQSVERHPMAKRVVLIEGSSTDSATLAKVKAEIPAGASVMVVLDFGPQPRTRPGRAAKLWTAGNRGLLSGGRRYHSRASRCGANPSQSLEAVS